MGSFTDRGILLTAIKVLLIILSAVVSNPTNSEFETINGSPIIVRPDHSSCSELLNSTTNCSTLACYTREENIRKYFTSNTKMVFLSGVHRLCGHPQISSIQNFTMITKENATFTNIEGTPQPRSIIECQYGGRAGFHFSNCANIQLHGLQFNSCGTNVTTHYIFCALCFEGVQDVNITHIVTNNTVGFGIHFQNSYGKLNVHNSAFLYSHGIPDYCNSGNAHFYFGHANNTSCQNHLRTELLIKSSWFANGNENFSDNKDSSGLTIFILCPSVHVHIDNITAEKNTGGNIALILTEFFDNPSRITMKNCNIRHGNAYKGGGLRILSNANINPNLTCTRHRHHEIILIENTRFERNQASISAGAVYIKYNESLHADCVQRHVVFKNCSFLSNFISSRNFRSYELRGGAALRILKFSDKGYMMHTTPQLAVKLDQCNFSLNYILDYNNSRREGSIVDVLRTGNVQISNCVFVNNTGTALSLMRSNIIFNGSIHFTNNSAAYGGALKVCDSSLLYLENNTKAYFIGNQANFTGGAIYAEQSCLNTVPACFFQLIVPSYTLVESLKNTTMLLFENNSALIAGDAIYGGALELCYTYQLLDMGHHHYGHLYSKEIFHAIFDLTGQTGFSKVSSNPFSVCLCVNNTPDCGNNYSRQISIYPGETFNISVVAVGQMNGTSPAYIKTNLIEGQSYSHMLVTNDTNVHCHHECKHIEYSLLSNRSHANIQFSPQIPGSSDIRSTHVPIHYPNVSVSIKPCPWGFALTPSPPYKCECDPLIHKYTVVPIQCDINAKTINVGSVVWVGNRTINGTSELILVPNCDHLYCKNLRSNYISLTTIDLQCHSGHTGVMCKSCSPGYSLAIGTSHCLKNCSNENAAWILILCLLIGILVVVLLSICNLTVTEGTINGLIFYANVVHLNRKMFFSKQHYLNFFRIFIAWLNLDFGIEVCFYKHLDAYQKIWFQFGFVLYICIVQILIIILSRNFIFVTRLVGKNVVNVMATLFLLCYAKMLRNIIFAFQFAPLHYSTRSHHSDSLVWFHDGSVQYLKGKHVPLFVVAFLLALVILLFTLVLLFIQFLQKQTEYRCLRWINRLRPFFDANTGCYRDHYHFWPGLLYFMRFLLYTLYSIAELFNSQKVNVMITGVFSVCIVILIIACVSPHGVYKKWPLNILEFFFILNLCILCISKNFSNNKTPEYISFLVTILTCVGILIYHTYKQFKTSRVRRALVTWNTRRQVRLNQNINNDTGTNNVADQESDYEVIASDEQKVNEDTPLLQQEMPPVLNVDQYREPLIASS